MPTALAPSDAFLFQMAKASTVCLVKVGTFAVPITRFADGRYCASLTIGTERRRVTGADLETVKNEAGRLLCQLIDGESEAAGITARQARIHIAAEKTLAPLGLEVDEAARLVVAAAKVAGGPHQIIEAANFWARHREGGMTQATVADVVTRFGRAKAAKGVSTEYAEQMRRDLQRLVDAHGELQITAITADHLEALLEKVGRWRLISHAGEPHPERRFVIAGAIRRNQVLASFATLFNFARARRYLPRDLDPVTATVEKHRESPRPIEIFTPEELQTLLASTAEHDPDWLPWMATGSLAGIRTDTVPRLDRRAYNWAQKVIEVPAAKAKVPRRYLPPILPALEAWLENGVALPATGSLTPKEDISSFTARLSRRTGIAWRKNGLRRSWITYRLAVLKNAAAVALEANTSEAKIFDNYRNVRTPYGDPVTEELAAQWFGTRPETVEGKIVQGSFRY